MRLALVFLLLGGCVATRTEGECTFTQTTTISTVCKPGGTRSTVIVLPSPVVVD